MFLVLWSIETLKVSMAPTFHSLQLSNTRAFSPTSLFDETAAVAGLGERFLNHWCLTLGLVMILGVKICSVLEQR